MKDYYDIYYLANKLDFNDEMLTKAMNTTFENRKRSFTIKQSTMDIICRSLFSENSRGLYILTR